MNRCFASKILTCILLVNLIISGAKCIPILQLKSSSNNSENNNSNQKTLESLLKMLVNDSVDDYIQNEIVYYETQNNIDQTKQFEAINWVCFFYS